MFLFLSGRRDGAFRVIPVTSDSGLLVSRSLRLALKKGFEMHSIIPGTVLSTWYPTNRNLYSDFPYHPPSNSALTGLAVVEQMTKPVRVFVVMHHNMMSVSVDEY